MITNWLRVMKVMAIKCFPFFGSLPPVCLCEQPSDWLTNWCHVSANVLLLMGGKKSICSIIIQKHVWSWYCENKTNLICNIIFERCADQTTFNTCLSFMIMAIIGIVISEGWENTKNISDEIQEMLCKQHPNLYKTLVFLLFWAGKTTQKIGKSSNVVSRHCSIVL